MAGENCVRVDKRSKKEKRVSFDIGRKSDWNCPLIVCSIVDFNLPPPPDLITIQLRISLAKKRGEQIFASMKICSADILTFVRSKSERDARLSSLAIPLLQPRRSEWEGTQCNSQSWNRFKLISLGRRKRGRFKSRIRPFRGKKSNERERELG